MKLDDLKHAWAEEVKVLDKKPEISLAIEALQSETQKIDRDIKRRDILESVIAFALVPVWIYGMFDFRSFIELAGLIILTLSCLYIPFKLRQARHKPLSKLTCIKAFLEHEKQKVQSQMTLLGSVVSWYLGPLFVGIILVRVGANFDQQGNFIINSMITHYLPLVVVFFLLVWGANVQAVKKKFKPMLEKIEQRLSELESE